MPYIVELAKDKRVDSVDIIVGETLSQNRKEMGWELPENMEGKCFINGCNVYIQPSMLEIESIFEKEVDNSVHLFSGIRGFIFVYNSFCTSLKYNVKRGIITERPNTFAFGLANGKPLWLHKIRFWLQDRKYIPYIHYIFAIGEDCADYYQTISTHWIIFPFAYCTTNPIIKVDKTKEEPIKLLYVGTLSWRKNVKKLIFAVNGTSNICINLVGDGPQRKDLEQTATELKLKDVHFMGYQKNSEIPAIMSSHDVLILPSVYDGWGAVVNEALMNGLYVICSDRCGAKDLLGDIRCGLVFRSNNTLDLRRCIDYVAQNIKSIRDNRQYRCQWAEEHIGGRVIANYMIDCLSGMDVCPPWKMLY